VALTALQRSVSAREWPAGARVIECRRRPRGCVVTDFTLLREACRHVIRIVGSLEILQVARDASRGRQIVIPIHMALRALHARVSSSQRETRLRMIKRRRHPCRRGVAHLALLWDSRGYVIWVRRSLKVL